MRDNRYEAYNRIKKRIKRIAIEILIAIPICILFGYLTQNFIKSNVLQILCFILIMGIIVLIGELIYKYRQQKKETIIETKKDVFK